jgi:methionyl-tRNA formyltransferase
VADHVRGMDMVPGAWTLFDDEPIKLFSPRVVEPAPGGGSTGGRADAPEPGTLLPPGPGGALIVATGEGGAVLIGDVQPPGKRRMPSDAWLRGRGAAGGERFR